MAPGTKSLIFAETEVWLLVEVKLLGFPATVCDKLAGSVPYKNEIVVIVLFCGLTAPFSVAEVAVIVETGAGFAVIV